MGWMQSDFWLLRVFFLFTTDFDVMHVLLQLLKLSAITIFVRWNITFFVINWKHSLNNVVHLKYSIKVSIM